MRFKPSQASAARQKRKAGGTARPTTPGRGLGTMIAGALAATAIAAAVLVSTANATWATHEQTPGAQPDTLILQPDHGQRGAPFIAIYEELPTPVDCGTRMVDFYLDNESQYNDEIQNYGAPMELIDGRCRALLKITPSVDTYFGIHLVRGNRQPYVGAVTVYERASADYTIDFPPESPAERPGASPSRQQASGSPGAAPSASRVGAKPPIVSADPLLAAASPDTATLPGPGFAIDIRATQASAAAGPEGRPRRNGGANGWRIGGGAAAGIAVASAIAVGVKRRRWSPTRV